MAKLKNNTLKNKSKEFIVTSDNWHKLFEFGKELSDIGTLIQHMAIHIKDLQDKVDNQSEELRRYQCKQCEHEWVFIGASYNDFDTIHYHKCSKCGEEKSTLLGI